MSQPANGLPPINRLTDPDAIPQALKDSPRWAPWRAVWNSKRRKYDKVPQYVNGLGLSTAQPDRWYSFDVALRAYQANPGTFTGVGYLMTHAHGIVGTDLDGCIADGVVAPWAQEIVDRLATYSEVSPSGTGLRMFSLGTLDCDWTNHEVGIEVYMGAEPRFLTVTGDQLPGSVDVLTEGSEALVEIADRYCPDRAKKATVISIELPELLDELALPDINTLELTPKVKDFLTEGKVDGDRSLMLHASAIELYGSGLSDAEVFSVMALNPYALEVCLDHRRQDHDRALTYLWVHQCLKAKPKARPRTASFDDFEVEPGSAAETQVNKHRFAFQQAATYLNREPIRWGIKRVLPRGEVGAIYGESGAGKSFFALDLCMAIALGENWRGHKVTQGKVAYVCAEGAGGFAYRLRAYAEYHGLVLSEVPLHVLGDSPNFLEKSDVKDLVVALRALGPVDFVIVDTLAQVTPGANENAGEDMGRAIKHCQSIHKALNAMVILIAHPGKDASKGIRGWSGIKGALDVEILIQRSGDNRQASITKQKDGDGEGLKFAFKLDPVTLDFDDDGDPITSCVLKESATEIADKGSSIPKNATYQLLVMRVAIELTDMSSDVTTDQLINTAVAQMPKDTLKKDRRRENVLRAVTVLSASGRISIADGKVQVL